MTETIIQLRPRSEWRDGVTIESLRAEMSRAVQLPGVTSIWTMPIINRIDMLSTGIRSEVGVKVFGGDLEVLDRLAREVADVLRTVDGAANVYPEPVASGQYLNVHVDREAAARYGLTVADVEQTVEYAIGEATVGRTIEGRERYPIRVRLAERFRSNPAELAQTPILTAGGAQVPLGSVATLESVRGPSMIAAENGLMLATVLLNVQGRDVVGFVEEAKAAVTARVVMPQGYFIGWSGRYENQQHARARLLVVLPLVLIVIFVLLYFTYHSAIEAAHVLLAVPFALTGGVYLVWVLDYNFSVAVWVGFIALFGTAVQTGMIMVIYLEDAVARATAAAGGLLTRSALRAAVMEGALLRLRPKVMTVSTVVAGLMPIMWSSSAGAEVMRPLAAPVLGGMVSSLLHVLVVTPVIFYWLRARYLPASDEPTGALSRRQLLSGLLIVGIVATATIWWVTRTPDPTAARVVVHEEVAGDVIVRLVVDDGREGLLPGRTRFVLEFSDAAGRVVDVRDVRVSSSMTMPGMVMTAPVSVEPAGQGRVSATAEFSMSGAWRFTVQWTGSTGAKSVAFDGDVR